MTRPLREKRLNLFKTLAKRFFFVRSPLVHVCQCAPSVRQETPVEDNARADSGRKIHHSHGTIRFKFRKTHISGEVLGMDRPPSQASDTTLPPCWQRDDEDGVWTWMHYFI